MDAVERWNEGVLEALTISDDLEWRNFLRNLLF